MLRRDLTRLQSIQDTLCPRARDHTGQLKFNAADGRQWAALERMKMDLPEPFVDEGFRGAGGVRLGCRMAQGGMLRSVWSFCGGLGLFTVIKSVEVDPTTEELIMVQRLVFDQRRDNATWAEPPWTPPCGAWWSRGPSLVKVPSGGGCPESSFPCSLR